MARSAAAKQLAIDAIAVLTGVLLAFPAPHAWTLPNVLLAVSYSGAVLWALHRYSSACNDRSLISDARRVLGATSIAALAMLGAESILVVPTQGTFGMRMWLFVFALSLAGRIVPRWVGEAGVRSPRRTLIVGAGTVGVELAGRLSDRAGGDMKPIGFVDFPDAFETSQLPRRSALRPLGTPNELGQIIIRCGVECVVFAFTAAPDGNMLPLVEECQRLGASVFVVPRFFEAVNWRTRLCQVDSLPLSELQWVDPHGVRFAVKHLVDRVVAALLAVMLAPLMAVIAILVKVSSEGPVLYRQRRVGRDGVEFVMLKFRTMRLAAPQGSARQFLPPAGCAPGGVEHEDRRTRVGIWLRRASLDELPQLFNVLRGEMSLIGPRPERPEYVREFGRDIVRYARRHRVKSGITGLAQVSGLRGQTSIAERARYDDCYIQNWSFWLDVKIALRTLPIVMRLRGE